ncbi:MAG TPA: helix-turn-helix domain-containing protein [Candidatus Levybacteria bacterium]|nr:helix-turn-helix domain-containing protein [Candidatus Levybacteria bacterium]
MTNMKVEEYYSLDEVAKLLKVAYLTVYRWVQTKKLTALKAGKQYRIKKEDLDSFLKNYKE